jgi:hypothetical protein
LSVNSIQKMTLLSPGLFPSPSSISRIATGRPSDCPGLPIVDPRGLLTPFFDGWSLDSWILTEDGHSLLPSRPASSVQRIELGEGLTVKTETHQDNPSLITYAEVQLKNETPVCRMRLIACADTRPGPL